MSLVVLTGYPCSGKSRVAKKLAQALQEDFGKSVHIVSENDYMTSRDEVFADARKQKELRATLKSETLRRIAEGTVVILDAGNYIKGFRYELYCTAKENKARQCTIYCAMTPEMARDWNEKSGMRYSHPTFDKLVSCYEEPDSRNRWDFPLFTVLSEGIIPIKEIHDALFLRQAPRPNQSTQMTPVTRPDFLYDVDKTTQSIVALLLEAQELGSPLETVKFPGCQEKVDCSHEVTAAQLRRLRRQFIIYYKTQVSDESHNAGNMFIQYLNKNFS